MAMGGLCCVGCWVLVGARVDGRRVGMGAGGSDGAVGGRRRCNDEADEPATALCHLPPLALSYRER